MAIAAIVYLLSFAALISALVQGKGTAKGYPVLFAMACLVSSATVLAVGSV